MLPIEASDRRRPSSLVYESCARILSRLSARPLVAIQLGMACYESEVSRRAARSIFLYILTFKISRNIRVSIERVHLHGNIYDKNKSK